ncbi:MAG TPA: hypothetical protein VKB87_00970 [Myxococcaceae bacterium]|nr:hypothetical protein [Myxococcaceae bacterium]
MDRSNLKSLDAMKTFDAFMDQAAVQILAAILGSPDHGEGLFPPNQARQPEDYAKLAYFYASALARLRGERG